MDGLRRRLIDARAGLAERVQAGWWWWLDQRLVARIGLAVAALLVPLLLGGVALAAASGSGGDDGLIVEHRTDAQTPTPTPTATRTPRPTRTPTPKPSPTERIIGSISELHDEFGEPPGATYGRFRIPALGVDAPMGVRSVGADGVMPIPSGPSDVVWYDFSTWAGLGGAPGSGGNAIFSGHVDYAAPVPWAGVDYRGRGVFYGVELLAPGDVIEIVINGQTLTYTVEWTDRVSAGGTSWDSLLSSSVGADAITMITCGGEFNTATRLYADRVIVRAVRA